MSKKRERDAAGVIHERVLREGRWVFERRRERLDYGRIADLAVKPIEQGGLGRLVSPKQLRALHDAHVDEIRELEEVTRDDERARTLVALDELEHEQRRLAGPIDEAATAQARRFAEAEGATGADLERIVVLRADADRQRALAAIERIHAQRTKLLGLDAPIEVKVEHRDATIDQLNDALAALGESPTKEKSHA